MKTCYATFIFLFILTLKFVFFFLMTAVDFNLIFFFQVLLYFVAIFRGNLKRQNEVQYCADGQVVPVNVRREICERRKRAGVRRNFRTGSLLQFNRLHL